MPRIQALTRIDGKTVKGYVGGTSKNHFIEDCILRDKSESHVLKNILKIYYDITAKVGNLKGKEFDDIHRILSEKLNGIT